MARTTRSTAAQDKDKPQDTPPQARKAQNKKRKRTSNAGETDLPAAKLTRTEDAVKEEDVQEVQELQTTETTDLEPPSSGEVPIRVEDAEKILEVLETVDTQGLLDRIFPLATEPSPDSTAGPSTGTQSYSFRALLKSPSNFPLRVLRTAVHHLFPISSHPRSRPSAPAAEQLRFCTLALSLLDQASLHSAPVPLNVESLLASPRTPDDANGAESKPTPTPPASPSRQRKHALVQRLPTGDYWSSTNSTYPSFSLEGKDLKAMGAGFAELVAIFPSAPVSNYKPTLGSYIGKRPQVLGIEQEARRLSCGKFLDYGPFASFAPTFDQSGVEVGQKTLSEVAWYKQLDSRRDRLLNRQRQLEQATSDMPAGETRETADVAQTASSPHEVSSGSDIESSLDGLLSSEQVSSVKEALGSLELEQAVDELLQRNARALTRLEQLQAERLLRTDGYKDVELESDEWNTAQSILDSLALLASLRPRTSDDADRAPLVPTASALRKLHRTIPTGSATGWYGTLPEGRTTALRDDTTLHVRSGAAAAAPAPAPSTPATPSTPAVQKPSATPYNYNYAPYANSQYRASYGTYTTGQTNYYPNYQTGTASSHYPNQQYGSSSGAQSYPYSSWYNYQPNSTQSGQATPQATPTSAAHSGYASFFANTQQPQPQRAVANTVLAGKTYQNSGWSAGTGSPYVAPLPSHLRTTVQTSAPGTPQPASATSNYSPYYAGYQGSQPAAR